MPARRRLAYALPAFGLAVVGIPVYVYLPKFYTDVVGVPVAAVGALLLAVRVFDAVSDPVIGALSDRTRTRHGRRRPWIALAPWPLAISILLLFAPPELGPGAATLWFGASIFALFLFWTAVTVPYEALGPEITFQYDERTGLLALRDGMLLVGTLAAASSPVAVAWALGLGDDDAETVVRSISDGTIEARLVYLAEDRSTSLTVGGLEALSAEQTYQIWRIRDGEAEGVGLFSASSEGTAGARFESELREGDVIAVTIEPAGGSPQPTSDPIFATEI